MNFALSIIILLAAVALYGYMMPRQLNQRYYTIVNLCFAVATIIFAKIAGASWNNLGFGANNFAKLAALIILLASILAVYALKTASNLTFKNRDYYQLFIRIPLGTALAEELIFRGSIMGTLLQNTTRLWALILSSFAFGLWHILPGPSSIWMHDRLSYSQLPNWLIKTSSGGITVTITFLGGIIFGWLRLAGGGILMAWASHTVINDVSWAINKSQKIGFVKGAKS
jgi:membrane protease YdiL (CAAX protease family)